MTTLGVFVKYPQPGRVKTRLAEFLGPERAAEVYAAFVRDIVERFRHVADRRALCFTPDTEDAREFFSGLASGGRQPPDRFEHSATAERITPSGGLRHPLAGAGDASPVTSDYELWPQPASGLGERMAAFVRDHLRQPDDRVVIIGSDSPTLPREYVTVAFEHLRQSDVVLGPATDGGFYLVGMRGRCWPIFDGIAWSTPTVLAETIDRVRQAGAKLALLPPWYDVDTEADFHLLRGHVAGLILAGLADDLPATIRVLGLDRESASSGL